jgi:hypothetical protein
LQRFITPASEAAQRLSREVVACRVTAYVRASRILPMPETAVPRLTLRPVLAAAAATGAVLAGMALLWAHYGTTVFFESIRAGFTACFG